MQPEEHQNINFDFKFQSKILTILFKNKEFIEAYAEDLLPEYFSDSSHQKVAKIILDYWKNYSSRITEEVLLDEVARVTDTKAQEVLLDTLQEILYDKNPEDLDYYSDRAIQFCRTQATVRALKLSVDKLKSGEIDHIIPALEKALSIGDLNKQGGLGFQYWEDSSKENVDLVTPKIPTLLGTRGKGGLDEILGGGLSQGALGLAIAPSGGGKSVFLLNIAGNAILQGYNVAYVSLELDERMLVRRFNQFYTGKTNDELIALPTPEIIGYIRQKYPNKKLGNLVIKTFPNRSISVRNVESYLTKVKKRYGWQADLICIDYLDLLKPTQKTKDNWIDLQEISYDLRALAQKLVVPVWTATQVTKVAFSSNQIGIEHSSGSYGKIFPADVVVTFGNPKKQEDSDLRITELKVGKNRDGSGSEVLEYEIDFSRMCFIYKEKNIGTVAEFLKFRKKKDEELYSR